MLIRKATTHTILIICFLVSASSLGGGWDNKKGLDQLSIEVELVCLGCSLKRLSGANAQCDLYSQHDVGVKLSDGSLWSIVNNSKGHDVIRAHKLVIGKKAAITGWLYPNANHIEIDTINIDGLSKAQVATAAWNEDQLIARSLLARKPGEHPEFHDVTHKH